MKKRHFDHEGHFIGIGSGGVPRFFHFRASPIASSATEWCVAQPILIGCLKGLGATPNKPTGGSCLDTDIACQFVKKLVEVRFLGHVMWIIGSEKNN